MVTTYVISEELIFFILKAVLPPVDNDERDYYECLGLPKGGGGVRADSDGTFVSWIQRKLLGTKITVTSDDIRKAYQAKLLELHPDVVAQRGQRNAEEAATEYKHVQEAYACLSNNRNRQIYHRRKCSSVRYKFKHLDGDQLYENLQRSSCLDKTRLVVFVLFFMLVVLLQPILIAAKVNQSLTSSGGSMENVSWTIVLIPLWIYYFFNTFIWMYRIFSIQDNNQALKLAICSLLQNVCWLAGFFVLALAWDHGLARQILQAQSGFNAMPSISWHILAIPFYLALVLRIIDHSLVMSMMRMEQAKCVTPEKFTKIQREHPSNASGEQARAERWTQLRDQYTVVTIREEAVAETLEALRKYCQISAAVLTDEEIEFLKVSHSPEYEEISESIQEKRRASGSILLFGIPFVAIVACKLQDQIGVSWWICFWPIWINLGPKFIYSCYMLGSAPLPSADGSDLVVVTAPQQRDEEAGSGTETNSTTAKDSSENQSTMSASDTFKASSTKWAPVERSITELETGSSDFDSNTATAVSLNHTNATSAAGSGGVQVKKGNDNKVEQNFEDIDPEKFRAWKLAHAIDKELEPMTQRRKLESMCCSAFLILLTTCLIAGKLEIAYPTENELPSNTRYETNVGYNSFWILFPIFVVTGRYFLCVWVCTIYRPTAPEVVPLCKGGPDAALSTPEHNFDIKKPHTLTHDASDPTQELEP